MNDLIGTVQGIYATLGRGDTAAVLGVAKTGTPTHATMPWLPLRQWRDCARRRPCDSDSPLRGATDVKHSVETPLFAGLIWMLPTQADEPRRVTMNREASIPPATSGGIVGALQCLVMTLLSILVASANQSALAEVGAKSVEFPGTAAGAQSTRLGDCALSGAMTGTTRSRVGDEYIIHDVFRFVFSADGSYSYEAGLEREIWTSHAGAFAITVGPRDEPKWPCRVTLRPNVATVRTSPQSRPRKGLELLSNGQQVTFRFARSGNEVRMINAAVSGRDFTNEYGSFRLIGR